ncbi:hypothetical protein SSTU70S_01633 [Stutzerimonas stutzeri]
MFCWSAWNLALLLFDSLFLLQPINEALARWLPQLHERYQQHIHRNLQYIDLGFVSLFILDVLLGWTVALFERRYARGTTTRSPTGTTCSAAFHWPACAGCGCCASARCCCACSASG